MGKLIVFEWISLDGVFDADYMGDWWEPYDSKDRQAYIQKIYNDADAFLMGRTTYDLLAPGWSNMHNNEMGVAANFNKAPKYIATSRPLDVPWQNAEALEEDITAHVAKLKKEHKNIVLVGSAQLAASLAEAGLTDEYHLLVQPVVVGEGKRFFADGTDISLELAASAQLPNSVLALQYTAAA